MPLFSEHIANMYYGSSSPYTGLPYSYSSSVSPLGSSYSASYLNPGGNYSSHSSLGSYSRTPVSSRWITSSGRNYAPMLSTISERGSASPVRISSPRRVPFSTRTYGTPNYTPPPRPLNINTADIDVSRDRYRHKVETPVSQPRVPSPPKEPANNIKENGPFMPRVDDKSETDTDSSPGVQRGTIKRGRTVVRLYTIKRKDKDSPRKPTEEKENSNDQKEQEEVVKNEGDTKKDETEFLKWREKLSDDLKYNEKREKKSLGAKLVEKFILKEDDKDATIPTKVQSTENNISESLPVTPVKENNEESSICSDRRCSMELLTEQANLLDSLIRSENLSTATIDLSKVGLDKNTTNKQTFESIKRRKSDDLPNQLKTTKSDYSLHESLNKSHKDVRDPRNVPNRRSIRKSSSGSCLRRLDSITEFPKENAVNNADLAAIEENVTSDKEVIAKQQQKPKLKSKITASVEVSAPMSPLKFVVENVTVEEKPRVPIKEITYSSEVEEVPTTPKLLGKVSSKNKVQNNIKKTITKSVDSEKEIPSPEPETGNFWDKIGKRETVYLMKRKQIIDEAKEKNKRALFWFPEDEEEPETLKEAEKPKNNITILDKVELEELPIAAFNNSIDNESKISSHSETSKIEGEMITECTKLHSEDNTVNIKNTSDTINDDTIIVVPPTVLNVSDLNKSNDMLIEVKSSLGDINASKSYISVVKDIANIGKSSSLDAITENKVKVPSLKKTKSEKGSKINKVAEKSVNKEEVKQDGLLPLTSNVKSEELNKSITEPIQEDTSNKQIAVEDKVASTEKLKNSECYKQEDKDNSSNKPCLAYPLGLQEENQTPNPIAIVAKITSSDDISKHVLIDHTIIDADKTILPCPIHGFQKYNEVEVLETKNLGPQKSESTAEKENKIINDEKVNNTEKVKCVPTATDIVPGDINSKIKSQSQTSEIKDLEINKNLKIIAKPSIELASSGKISNERQQVDKTDKILSSSTVNSGNKEILAVIANDNKPPKQAQVKVKDSNDTKVLKPLPKVLPEVKLKNSNALKKQNDFNKSNKTEKKLLNTGKTSPKDEEPSTSSGVKTKQTSKRSTLQKINDANSSSINTDSKEKPTVSDVADKGVAINSQDIPNNKIESKSDVKVQNIEKTGEENKADKKTTQKDDKQEISPEVNNTPKKSTAKMPVKEEKAMRPLIATPRPLQKKAPQIIHSSDSSDSSSEEESSEEDDSESSEDSTEFYECENNPDGRTSTGSNDSGFDSSAPTSPATFSQIKKDCDVNCHRKCEKLTANLCGVNQRLLVEALASRTSSNKKGGEASATSSSAPAQQNNIDILEQELEQSTAYDIFRKTGRFTPPARSIPRFRKYTIEDFQFIKVLGKGSFGKVLLAELRDTEYYYAVKCLKKDVVLEDDDVECTLIERKVLALGTNHPYLCHLFATFQTDSHLFFVMEYLNGGDLMFHIQQSGRFPESRARFYAAEIVSGLKFLHKRGIVYRDLKLDNILLDFEGHVRIADFGMCKLQIYLEKTADTFCGTPDYMAPEIIKGLKYSQTVDWWSFGVLLYEMLIGQSPFSGCDEDELFWSICNEMPSYPRFLSRESLSILTRLLDKDARTRLGGTECMHGDIRDQEFFHQIHWDRLERRELEAPFRPRVRHPMDTQYFDRAFTGERPRLTAVEPHVLRSMDQGPFRGFSYTNPNTTDR